MKATHLSVLFPLGLLFGFSFSLVLSGCSIDQGSLDPGSRSLGTTVHPDVRAFRIAVPAAAEDSELILDGADLAFDRQRGQVTFRAALVNAGERPLFAPLLLVIEDLSPTEVRVLDAEGQAEDGSPLYDFSQEIGDDGTFSPGEASLRIRMTFADPQAAPFELGAVLETGIGPPHAAVGGIVFLDQNPNGRRDRGEAGLPGIPVTLIRGAKTVAQARTDRAGRYLFLNVAPGLYAVRNGAADLASVTPNPLHVALAPAANGQAASFLAGDLACFRRSEPGQAARPLLGPLQVPASGETITGRFALENLPRMPLLLVLEMMEPEKRTPATAEVMVNGERVLAGGDFTPDSPLVRCEILPDLLRLGLNTVEARAETTHDEEESILVATVFGQ